MKKVGSNKGFITGFDWSLHPKTEKFLNKEINNFIRNNKFTKKLAKSMLKNTSTNLIDWIDHISIPEKKYSLKFLKKLGFQEVKLKSPRGTKVYKNLKTIYFPLLLTSQVTTELVLKPENLDHCIKKLGHIGLIQGEKFSPIRKATINVQKNYILSAVERRGSNNLVIENNPKDIKQYKKAFEIFSKRKRKFKSDKVGLQSTIKLIKSQLKRLSKPRIADAFFRNERAYWESRNNAGKTQKKRQDILGLGWGNHDHHTYRASRKYFTELIRIFELMGYGCRERFFAGEKAGWGAQILEHPQCDIVVFADTDITKAEKK